MDNLYNVRLTFVCHMRLHSISSDAVIILQRTNEESDKGSDSDDDDYVPYIPVKQRKKAEVVILLLFIFHNSTCIALYNFLFRFFVN